MRLGAAILSLIYVSSVAVAQQCPMSGSVVATLDLYPPLQSGVSVTSGVVSGSASIASGEFPVLYAHQGYYMPCLGYIAYAVVDDAVAGAQVSADVDFVMYYVFDVVSNSFVCVAASPVGFLQGSAAVIWHLSTDGMAARMDSLIVCLQESEDLLMCDRSVECGLGGSLFPYREEDYFSEFATSDYGLSVNNAVFSELLFCVRVWGYCSGFGNAPLYRVYYRLQFSSWGVELIKVCEVREPVWDSFFACADTWLRGARPGADSGDIPVDDNGTSQPVGGQPGEPGQDGQVPGDSGGQDGGTPGDSDGSSGDSSGDGSAGTGSGPSVPGVPGVPGAPEFPEPQSPSAPTAPDGDSAPVVEPIGIADVPLPGAPPSPVPPPAEEQPRPVPQTPHPCWDVSDEPSVFYVAPVGYVPKPWERVVYESGAGDCDKEIYLVNGLYVSEHSSVEDLAAAAQFVNQGYPVRRIRVPETDQPYVVVQVSIDAVMSRYKRVDVVRQLPSGWDDSTAISVYPDLSSFGTGRVWPALYTVEELDEATVRKALSSDGTVFQPWQVGALIERDRDRIVGGNEVRGMVVVPSQYSEMDAQADAVTSAADEQMQEGYRIWQEFVGAVQGVLDHWSGHFTTVFTPASQSGCPRLPVVTIGSGSSGLGVTYSTDWCDLLREVRTSFRWLTGLGMLVFLTGVLRRFFDEETGAQS